MNISQILTLLQMAISLLISVNSPNVPQSLRDTAVSLANYSIAVANQSLQATPPETLGLAPAPVVQPYIPPTPTPTPPPPPKPVVPPPPAKPVLTSQPILTYSIAQTEERSVAVPARIVDTLEFTSDQDSACDSDPTWIPTTSYVKHCIISGTASMRKSTGFLKKCNAEQSRFNPNPYLFVPDREYTCSILLIDREGVETLVPFTFTPS